MFRAMVFFLLVLFALLYLQQSDANKYTITDVKEALFPETPPIYNYYKEEDKRGFLISYFFSEPRPKIDLTMSPDGKYFHITNVSSINSILSHLKLPKLKSGVRELASITGSHTDSFVYRWEDYSQGILIIYRTQCRRRERLETFNCLERIIIKKRYRD